MFYAVLKKIAKTFFFLGLILGVIFIGCILVVLVGPTIADYAQRTEFNSVSWKNEDLTNDSTSPVRLRMVDDLLKKHELIGMSRNQIDELLGVPKPTGYFRDYEYVYWLGPERGFISVDSEWLGIKFKNNIVVEARILRD